MTDRNAATPFTVRKQFCREGRGGTGKRFHSPFFALQPALWSITAVCPQWQQAEYRPPTADWGEDCTEEKC